VVFAQLLDLVSASDTASDSESAAAVSGPA